MKRIIVSCILLCGLSSGYEVYSQKQRTQLGEKEYFTTGFPRQMIFRGEYADRYFQSYEQFCQATEYAQGIILKWVPNDEMSRLDPVTRPLLAQRYATEHPEKLMLLHWNAEGHCNNIPSASIRYSPQHRLQYIGTCLTSPITASSSVLTVKDLQLLTLKTVNPKAAKRSKYLFPNILLVETDSAGNKCWERSEYVCLEEVNETQNTIRVKRGHALSEPRDFPAGSMVIPLSAYVSSPWLFSYNFSKRAPLDHKGLSASDILFTELTELLNRDSGSLSKLDGIAFDVLEWEPSFFPKWIDADCDGKPDGGIDPATGENLYRKGALELMLRLRAHFGEEFIFTSDSYLETNQRGIGIFNGLESEGLVRHNDPFRGFSKTLNIFTYWMERNPAKYKIGYIVPKIMNPMDIPKSEQYIRLCQATAAALGVATVRSIQRPTTEEIKGGEMERAGWLGFPVAPMRNLALEGTDLLHGEGTNLTDSFIERWSSANASIHREGDEMIIRGKNISGNTNPEILYENFNVGTSGEDITISFQIRATEGLTGLSPSIPRVVWLEAEGLPVYETNKRDNELYNNMFAYFDTGEYTHVTFYYRNVAGRKLNFRIKVEGNGEFRIKDFKIYDRPSLVVREFENGVVLCNPSFKARQFDLKTLFGDRKLYRLKGNTSPNTGTAAGSSIEVPAVDALFLRIK